MASFLRLSFWLDLVLPGWADGASSPSLTLRAPVSRVVVRWDNSNHAAIAVEETCPVPADQVKAARPWADARGAIFLQSSKPWLPSLR